jgi:hypothetical protein
LLVSLMGVLEDAPDEIFAVRRGDLASLNRGLS